jgi:hypothetical protein
LLFPSQCRAKLFVVATGCRASPTRPVHLIVRHLCVVTRLANGLDVFRRHVSPDAYITSLAQSQLPWIQRHTAHSEIRTNTRNAQFSWGTRLVATRSNLPDIFAPRNCVLQYVRPSGNGKAQEPRFWKDRWSRWHVRGSVSGTADGREFHTRSSLPTRTH